MPNSSQPSAEVQRTFWQRRVRDPIVAQLTQGITPEKIALTLAVGSTVALFPILGTTAFLCLIAGLALRLNQPIIQAVNVVCTPIHLPFIFYALRWGARLFHAEGSLPAFHTIRRLLLEHPMQFVEQFGLMVFHACVVWAILAPFWALAIYHIFRPVLRGIARARLEAVAKVAAEKTRDHPIP